MDLWARFKKIGDSYRVTSCPISNEKNAADVVIHDSFAKRKEIRVSSTLSYYCDTIVHNALETDKVWRVKRVYKIGSSTYYDFASSGDYVNSIEDIGSLFTDISLENTKSLSFNGSNQLINFGDNYTFGPAIAFSWSLWIKSNNFSQHRRFISKTTQDTNVYGYNFGHDTSGRLWAQIRAPGTLRAHTFQTALNPLEWYHIVFTYNGGSNMNGLKAYINGVAEPSVPSASLNPWTVTDPLTIGARGNTFYYSGLSNNISLYNKELSSTEVLEVYNGGSPTDLTKLSTSPNILSWWGLNLDDNFPTEVDKYGSINGTLVSMNASNYVLDVP